MIDLNTLIPVGPAWVLSEATAINDGGQIVGTGGINGQTHAFLLTPGVARPHPQALICRSPPPIRPIQSESKLT
jgi:probable HAF family extracellular repeat protein